MNSRCCSEQILIFSTEKTKNLSQIPSRWASIYRKLANKYQAPPHLPFSNICVHERLATIKRAWEKNKIRTVKTKQNKSFLLFAIEVVLTNMYQLQGTEIYEQKY